jgi:hypothetical protein
MKRKDVVPGSQPAYRSNLNYFNNVLQDTDISIVSSHVETCIPYFSLSDPSVNLEFHVNSGSNFIDLKNSTLYLQLKVVKANNETLPVSEKVSCVNLLLHSLFRECEVILNGTPIFSNGENYALKSYIKCQLGMSTERKTSDLCCALYHEDDSGAVSILTDKGQKKRESYLGESKVVELEGSLFDDIWQQGKYIPNGVNMIVRLKRNVTEFVLLVDKKVGGTGSTPSTVCPYSITISQARLKILKLSLDPALPMSIQKHLDSGKLARIPMKRSELKYLYIPSNLFTAMSENIVVGKTDMLTDG